MATLRICDRCKKPIPTWDELLQETLDRIYIGQDICPNCDLAIVLRQTIAKESSITGESESAICQRMLEMYERPV